EGESFEDLAKIFSQDPSAAQGGSLGYIKKGEMVKPFEEAAFNAPLYEVVGPVKTQYGYHLIRVEDRRVVEGETQVKISHILFRIDVGPNTLDNIASEARIFAFDAQDLGFEKALQEYNLKADTTEMGITEDNYFYPGLGFVPNLTQWAYRNKVGTITEEPLETEQYFIVAQIIEEKPESYQSFKELSPTLERQLRQKKKEEKSRQIALALAAENKPLSELKEANPYVLYGQEKGIILKDPPAAFKNNPTFKDIVYNAPLERVVGPVKTSTGFTLIQVMRKGNFDESAFQSQREAIYKRLRREKEGTLVEAFLKELKEKAKINDYRSKFF
ncbi:MAG: peptidylprolyl isomerase, partial [Candidatus Marinimicrobia bacterium]|nr:peptidylprolyl isomerase [Candidatus Neomarinimicrobiota bacterium]